MNYAFSCCCLALLLLLLFVDGNNNRHDRESCGTKKDRREESKSGLLTVFRVSRKSLILMCVIALGSLGFSSAFLGRAMSLVGLRVGWGIGG